MKKKLLLSLIVIFSSFVSLGQRSIVVDSTFSSTSMSSYVSTFDQLQDSSVSNPLKLPFKKYKNEEIYFGTDRLAHWVLFDCENQSQIKIPLVVELELVYATKVNLYIYQDETLINKFENLSWKTPYYNRIIPSRYFAFPLEINPHKNLRIIFSIQEDSGVLFCPITLWSRSSYNHYYESFLLLFMLPVSILILVFLSEIVISMIYRFKILFFHALYTFGTLGYMLSTEGFLPQFAPNFVAGIEGYAIFSYLMWIGYLSFTKSFFFQRYSSAIWFNTCFYLIIIFLYLMLFLTLVLPFTGIISDISLYPNSIIPIIILIGGIIAVYYKSDNYKLYLTSLIPILFGGLLNILSDNEIIPKNNAFYLSIYSAPVLNIIILAIGVALHYILERQQLLLNLSEKQQELIKTQDIERTRLAQDLHDDLGGTLSAIKGKVSNETKNTDTLNLVEKAIDDLRNISRNLLPPELSKNGLSKAIQQSVERLQGSSLVFTFITFGSEKRMNNDRELNIFRVVSELINNIVKHSKATKATIQVIFYDEYLHLSIEDNGIGIKTLENDLGIGLKNVNSRIEFLKAKLLKDSSDKGTTFIIEVSYC